MSRLARYEFEVPGSVPVAASTPPTHVDVSGFSGGTPVIHRTPIQSAIDAANVEIAALLEAERLKAGGVSRGDVARWIADDRATYRVGDLPDGFLAVDKFTAAEEATPAPPSLADLAFGALSVVGAPSPVLRELEFATAYVDLSTVVLGARVRDAAFKGWELRSARFQTDAEGETVILAFASV